jgi:hypothetical protein
MARGDAEESRKLTDTCPRRTYTMNEPHFTWRWDGAIYLTMAMLMDLRQLTGRLRMIDAFRMTLPYLQGLRENDTHAAYFDGHSSGSRHAWKAAGKEGAPPGWEDDDEEADKYADAAIEEDLERIDARNSDVDTWLTDILDRLERELASEAITVWAAYLRFCGERLEIDAKKILKATFKPALEDVRWLEGIAERLTLEPETAAVEEYRAEMAEGWRKVMRNPSL